jgi:hypothetical protein
MDWIYFYFNICCKQIIEWRFCHVIFSNKSF